MTDVAFWDRIAPKYAKHKISNPDAYEQTLARVRSHLSAEARVLELGCGTGSTALRLVDAVKSYVATDFSPAMIGIAQAKLDDHEGPAPEFRVAEITPEAFPDAPFDVVMAFNLLHLLPDLEGALDTIHGLVAEGGLFIMKAPALSEKWYYRPLIGAMRMVGRAPSAFCYRIAEYDAMISAAGFRLVETGLYPPSVPSRFVVAQKV